MPPIELDILKQPDDTACGPTCLHAVYRFFGVDIPIDQLVAEVPMLETGGTLAVLLGTDARRRGLDTTLFTFNLHVWDPTWFELDRQGMQSKLRTSLGIARDHRTATATAAYLEYLEAGGDLRFEDLTARLLRGYLRRGLPILAGLSATYLYRSARELDDPMRVDDLRGAPQGHFVVLCGYSPGNRTVLVADPLRPNPLSPTPYYEVGIERLVCSILLGTLTFDGNLLVVRPARHSSKRHAGPDRGRQSG